MWHATKKIECDTHSEEYFQSHYQFSQGFVKEYYDEDYAHCYVHTLLFSKCQKDPLSTVSSVIVDSKMHFPQCAFLQVCPQLQV